jgi:hypothetical protein
MNHLVSRQAPSTESKYTAVSAPALNRDNRTHSIFREIHVSGENISSSTVLKYTIIRIKFSVAVRRFTHHLLAQEIFLQRSLAHRIILQCDIPIRAERTGEYGNIPKYRLQRLIEDIRHLVLEVLRRHYITTRLGRCTEIPYI